MTLAQVESLEQSIRYALQKLERWRDADAFLGTKREHAPCTPSSVRKSKGQLRHAENDAVAALDTLRDEITPIITESIARGCNTAIASLQEKA